MKRQAFILAVIAICLAQNLQPANAFPQAATETCVPGPSTVVNTPYSVCNPYTVSVPTGAVTCGSSTTYGAGSADFGGDSNCSQQTIQQVVPNCTTYYRQTVVAGPQVCTKTPYIRCNYMPGDETTDNCHKGG